MIYLIKIITAFIYSMGCFAIGFTISLIRPFNANNLYLTGKVLRKYCFQILGVNFIKRGSDLPDDIYPVVFMSNHQNNIDLMAGGSCVKPKTVLLGKKSILWIPVFGQFYALSGNLLINRKNSEAAKKSMQELTRKIIDHKLSVWVLPEGTRSRGAGLLPFKKGGFITAINAQVPIIPVVFNSYAKTLELSKLRSGTIIAKFMEPIPTKGLTMDNLEELIERTHSLFEKTINELDAEIAGVLGRA